MPAPTNSEKLHELQREVTTLVERTDHFRGDMAALGTDLGRVSEAQSRLERQLAVFEERLANMKAHVEEFDKRRFTIQMALISALVGGVFALLVQLILRSLSK